MPTTIATPSADQRERLTGYEERVERGKEAWYDVGTALAAIRDEELWKLDGHASFQAYLTKRFEFSQSYASRLITGAEVVKELASTNLLPIGKNRTDDSAKAETKPKPPSESVARELAKAPVGKRAETLKAATETAKASGKPAPTAKDVAAAVEKAKPKKEPAKPKPAEPDVDLKKNPTPWAGVNERIDRITGLYSQLKAEIVELGSLNGSEGIYVGWLDLKAWRKTIDNDVKTFDGHKVKGLGSSKLSKADARPFIYEFEAKK